MSGSIGKTVTTGSLPRLPLNTFAIGFGIAGIAETWSAASGVLHLSPLVDQILWTVAAIAWVWLIVAHIARGIQSGERLVTQLRHSAQGPLAAIVPIIGMLLGTELARWFPVGGMILAIASMIVTAAFAAWLVSSWLTGSVELGAVHGGYLLPTVAGGYIAATAAGGLGLDDLGWAAFGVATLFWFIMTTVVLVRLITRPQLPDALVPTLAVIVAPPAVGGLALFDLTGDAVTPLSLALAGLTVVLAMGQLALIPRYRRLPFTLGFWSFTFPIAAVIAYAITWTGILGFAGNEVLAALLASLVSAFIAVIGIRSLKEIAGRRARLRAEDVLTRADDIDALLTRSDDVEALEHRVEALEDSGELTPQP
jgi:tellurite resistance protein